MIKHFRVHYGRGAFRIEKFDHEGFMFKEGLKELLPDFEKQKVIPPESEEESEESEESEEEEVKSIGFDDEEAVFDYEAEDSEED